MLPGRPRRSPCGLIRLGLLCWCASVAGQVSDEASVKAAILTKFPAFVEWPSRVLDGRPALELCIWSPNPFGDKLAEFVKGEALGGRPLMVRELTAMDSIASCHVLFLHGGSVRTVLGRVGTQPILTVGDSERFLEEGGIVQLVRARSRVGFNIDRAAADRAGLRLSSQLLELAENLRRSRP
jgi:hypothetical protein